MPESMVTLKMLMALLFFMVCNSLLAFCQQQSQSATYDSPFTRIAFGSCANQSAPQPIWKAVLDFDPQLFIWLGDNIYADVKRPVHATGKERTYGPWKNSPRFSPATEKIIEESYQQAKNNPGYVDLRARTKVVGTWDDHDYGLDDSGKELLIKNVSQKLLLDFLDEPENSTRRRQEGVYTSYTFGPAGKQIKVILLDTRYHRDPLFSNGELLGHKQWVWLKEELENDQAQVTIIGSSIQVLANFSATVQPLFYVESWSHFPRERERLFKLLYDTNISGIIFISGDVHFCEITRYDCAINYPLYEITSSGLTQAVEYAVKPSLSFLIRFAAWLTPSTMRVYNQYCRYKSCAYGKPNFGTIEVLWDTEPVSITIQVRDVSGIPVTGINISLSDLQPRFIDRSTYSGKFKRHCTREIDLPWHSKHLLAMFFFGTISVLLLLLLLLSLYSLMFLRKLLKRKVE